MVKITSSASVTGTHTGPPLLLDDRSLTNDRIERSEFEW